MSIPAPKAAFCIPFGQTTRTLFPLAADRVLLILAGSVPVVS